MSSLNKNSRKSTENICEQSNITETENWIRLLIFNDFDDLNFFVFQPVPIQHNRIVVTFFVLDVKILEKKQFFSTDDQFSLNFIGL